MNRIFGLLHYCIVACLVVLLVSCSRSYDQIEIYHTNDGSNNAEIQSSVAIKPVFYGPQAFTIATPSGDITLKKLGTFKYRTLTDVIEVVNLPSDWKSIKVDSDDNHPQRLPSEIKAYSEMQIDLLDMTTKGFTKENWVVLTFYGVLMLALLLSTANAQAQFSGEGTVNLCLLIMLLGGMYTFTNWELPYAIAFISLALGHTILFGKLLGNFDIDITKGKSAVMVWSISVALSVSSFVLVGIDKDYKASADWVSQHAIAVYVPPEYRHSLQLEDENENALLAFELSTQLDNAAFVVWQREQAPRYVKATSKSGDAKRIELDERPGDESSGFSFGF